MAKKISTSPKAKPKRKIRQPWILQKVKIQNRLGLHARAAAAFVKLAFRFRSEIEVQRDKLKANGKSIMGLLTLAAAEGVEITIAAQGPDAQQAITDLVQLVNDKFGEG